MPSVVVSKGRMRPQPESQPFQSTPPSTTRRYAKYVLQTFTDEGERAKSDRNGENVHNNCSDLLATHCLVSHCGEKIMATQSGTKSG
jgi:hypothetical protein